MCSLCSAVNLCHYRVLFHPNTGGEAGWTEEYFGQVGKLSYEGLRIQNYRIALLGNFTPDHLEGNWGTGR